MRSFITTFLTGVLAITSTYAFPISELTTRDVTVAPAIISPVSETVWGIGKQAAVSWDSAKVPKGADPFAALELFATGGTTAVAQLATNFNPTPGIVTFVVPQVSPGAYIVKIGDSASPQFQIVTETVQFLPDIADPAKDTTWKVGKTVTVTWDKSSVPQNTATIPYLDLFTDGYGSSPLFVARLARNINVYAGSVEVKVPEVRAGSSYLIMLGGYTHRSNHFTIEA
ncbi:hypothetical protein BDY19DRAFT_991378 [Irpex rosettiformis]|uniref:Uncharacterized protein n=1 Tax=Irpex rosettiformis TaxID=378272 RepID=A0ACB8UBT0_9APHY|nr:hypothetical protein BDY19DRAFT_991378 [Irpex rosettiformis]